MKRLIILLTMVLALLLIVGCGSKTKTVTVDPNPELLAQVDDLTTEVDNLNTQSVDLEEFKVSCQSAVGSQDEVITALIDDNDACVAEYLILQDVYDDLLTSEPEATEEPEDVEDGEDAPLNPDYPSHVCIQITASNVPIFESRTNANGKLKLNAAGNMLLKRVSVADVKLMVKDWIAWEYANLKDTGRYQANDTVCISDNPIQADGGRVLLIISGPFSRYYIPTWAIKQP